MRDRPKSDSATQGPPTGWPHGEFLPSGKWLPIRRGTCRDPRVREVVRDLIHVRRTEKLSPPAFLLRLRRYRHADLAAQMLGEKFIQRMAAAFDESDDWACLYDEDAPDFACWLRHCGRPYRGHSWDDCGHWVPVDAAPPPDPGMRWPDDDPEQISWEW